MWSTHTKPLFPWKYLPFRVVYVWAILFLSIMLTAFLYYTFNQASQAIIAALTSSIPESYSSTGRASTDMLYRNVWNFSPLLCIFAVFVWSLIHIIKARRRAYAY